MLYYQRKNEGKFNQEISSTYTSIHFGGQKGSAFFERVGRYLGKATHCLPRQWWNLQAVFVWTSIGLFFQSEIRTLDGIKETHHCILCEDAKFKAVFRNRKIIKIFGKNIWWIRKRSKRKWTHERTSEKGIDFNKSLIWSHASSRHY